MPDGKNVDAKNENVDEKNWKNEFDFWILRIKIRLNDNFHENLRKKTDPFLKKFLTNRSKIEDENENIWKNEFNCFVFHIKIRL